MTASPLFDAAEAARAELHDLLLTVPLPEKVKDTYRDLLKAAGNDVRKLTDLTEQLRAKARRRQEV